jgi:phenylacetate-CoA ligase
VSCLLPVAEIAAELERLAPDAIIGYPSSLARVGEYLTRHGRERLAPRVIYTGGESRDAEQERRIVRGFGGRLYDVYGTIELDLAAWECPEAGSLHWCEDNLVPEILKDGRPVEEGEAGELFVTSLHGATMPLVRFALGDVVVRGPERCPCGQPFATLGRIEGRTIHYLELPDREPVHPFALTSPLIGEEGHWMDQHQLVQEAPDRLVLRIAPLGTPPPGAEERLVRRAAELLEGRARLEVEWVERFEPGPGGKFHPYVNRLRQSVVPPA